MVQNRKVRLRRQRTSLLNRTNWRRVRDKQNRLPGIENEHVRKAWDKKLSLEKNMSNMGLAYDPNKALKIPSIKEIMTPVNLEVDNLDEDMEVEQATKAEVAETLEKEAKRPRQRNFELPKGTVRWLTKLMNKYGEDYKAMAKDKSNYYQDTWKQIRARITQFKKIPSQYNEYLRARERKKSEMMDVKSD